MGRKLIWIKSNLLAGSARNLGDHMVHISRQDQKIMLIMYKKKINGVHILNNEFRILKNVTG